MKPLVAIVALLTLSGCVTLYPEYMTGACIGLGCTCANTTPAPDQTGERRREQIERLIK